MKKHLSLLLAVLITSVTATAQNPQLWGLTFGDGGGAGEGTIFRIKGDGTGFAAPYAFTGTAGAQSYGSPMQATNGLLYGMTWLGGANNYGVIFSYDTGTGSYTKLFDFDGAAHGSHPWGALIQASNGLLYGMAANGGTYNYGVMFSYNINTATYTKLFDFDGTAHGGNPFGDLMQASNGLLYGMTYRGGTIDTGVIFSYNIGTGTYTKLLDFNGVANGSEPRGKLTQANNGVLYGLTQTGGIYNYGVIFSYDIVNAAYTKLVDFNDTANGAVPYGSLMLASNGLLYGMTAGGGANGVNNGSPGGNYGAMFSYNTSNATYTKVLDFGGTTNGSTPYNDLVQAGNGLLYGMTGYGGANNYGVIFSYNPNTGQVIKMKDLTFASGVQPWGRLVVTAGQACDTPVVAAITGPTTLCASSQITLADDSTGGIWGSSNHNIATVNAGVVAGVAAGTDTITYSVTNGCSTTSVIYPVTVNAVPTVNAVSNQSVCAGATVNAVNFTGSTVPGTIYNWTCSDTSIGLAASGTGSIASFTGHNTGSTAKTATITATPMVSAGYAYIPNFGSNNISVINTSTNTVIDTIHDSGPSCTTVSPDGSKVYVGSGASNSVSVINTATNSVVATINVGREPYGIAVTPDGSKVYVADYNSDSVSVINAATNTVSAIISTGSFSNPMGIAVSPDGSKVYVTNNSAATVTVISTSTNAVMTTIHVRSQPLGIAVSPDGNKVYITSVDSNSVSVINALTNTVTANINVGQEPFGIAISPDGSKLYCSNLAGQSVYVINTSTNVVSDTIRVGVDPDGLALNSDGSKLYVINENSDNVSVISTATNTVIDSTAVGALPYAFANFITRGSGCNGTPINFTITVNPIPTAGITGTATGCGQVNLTATGGGTYVWSGGSSPNTAANTFTSSNTYTVTVTGTGSCTATASAAVTVNTAPTATITHTGGTTFCTGDSVILTASAANGYTWSNTATTQSITVKQTGNYTVVVNSAAGCSATSTATVVTVNSLPNAAINGPTTICSGLSATLTASGGTSYNWSGGLGTNAQITVSPVSSTPYTVTVTNANNCSATATQTVSVTSTPTASITGATQVCDGSSVTLTANGGNTYSWANSLGSNAAITVSPTVNTTYTVTATIGANCSAIASQTVTVNQPAASQFSHAVCAGQTYNFNNSTLTQSGAYNDTLQTINGCDSIVTLHLTVNSALQTSLTDTACEGRVVIFNGHNLTQQGVYKDTLQSAMGCDSVVTLSLFINSATLPTINRSNDTLQTQIYSSYQWLLNGLPATNGTNQDLVVTQNGNFSVIVTNANGCTDTSTIINVTDVGIKDIATGYTVQLYPNPNNGNFTLQFNNNVTRSVSISDVTGRVIVAAQPVAIHKEFDCSVLAAGVYLLQINENGEVRTLRFVVTK